MKENFVLHPNLPDGKVTLAAVGDYPDIVRALHEENIRTFSFRNPLLPKEVSSHQDMLLCHVGDSHIFCDPSQDKSILRKEGFSVYTGENIGSTYPHDVKLNAAVGNRIYIYNPATIDGYLNDELLLSGYLGFQTKQGYTKCSVCFVTETAVITEDASIAAALKNTDFDVLMISKGDIYLSEKHYGFFGGSTGKINKDILAVTGELKYHRDGEKIRDFCEKHGVTIKELQKGRITDIGSILPLKQKS
ncbi:MAG: hypothetical protein IKL47_07300 [Clostridia bacterium]|nr:hypothetical protein [Clostridia bacterium]